MFCRLHLRPNDVTRTRSSCPAPRPGHRGGHAALQPTRLQVGDDGRHRAGARDVEEDPLPGGVQQARTRRTHPRPRHGPRRGDRRTSASAEAHDAIDEMLRIARYFTEQMRETNPAALYDLQKYYRPCWERLDAHHNDKMIDHVRAQPAPRPGGGPLPRQPPPRTHRPPLRPGPAGLHGPRALPTQAARVGRCPQSIHALPPQRRRQRAAAANSCRPTSPEASNPKSPNREDSFDHRARRRTAYAKTGHGQGLDLRASSLLVVITLAVRHL